MNIKTSSFNIKRTFEFYKISIRRSVGFGAAFVFFTSIFMFVPYYLEIDENAGRLNPSFFLYGASHIYTEPSVVLVPAFLMLGVGVLTVYLFSFIHSKTAVDVYHSLPVKRTEIFVANMFAVMTYVLAFLLLCYLPLSLHSVFYFDNTEYIGYIFADIGFHFVMALSIFAITAFASVNVGTVVDNIIYTLALVFGFLAVYGILYATIQMDLDGFYTPDYLENIISYISVPVLFYIKLMQEMMYRDLASIDVLSDVVKPSIIWGLISIGLIALSIFIYKRRKSEKAQSVGQNGALQLLVRIGGAYIGGVGLTLILRSSFDIYNYLGFCTTTFFSTLVIFALLEIILNRSVVKVFKNIHIGVILAIFVMFLNYSISSGFYGFTYRVPEASEVESVEIYSSKLSSNIYIRDKENALDVATVISDDLAVIESVISIHQNVLDINEFNNLDWYSSSVVAGVDITYIYFDIAYHLNNGTVMLRNFNAYIETSVLEEAGLVIHSSEDFLSGNILNTSSSDISQLTIYPSNYDSATTSLVDITYKKDELIEALNNDILATTSEDILGAKNKVYEISVYTENDLYYSTIPVYDYYENTMDLFENSNIYGLNTGIDTENVKNIYLADIDDFYIYDNNLFNNEARTYTSTYEYYEYYGENTDVALDVDTSLFDEENDVTEQMLSLIDEGFDEFYTSVPNNVDFYENYQVILVCYENATSTYIIPVGYLD